VIVTSHLLTQQSPFSLKKRANYRAHQHSYVGGTTGPISWKNAPIIARIFTATQAKLPDA
jgi:hypothetical protein